MLVGDLFAGIGGIAKGFMSAGYQIAWANELDKRACMTYRANFEHQLIEGSIAELRPASLPKVDILTGGFPCQSFSIAGNREGLNDSRGNLFYDIMRLADELQPPVIFLENVDGLLSHENGNTFTKIIECLIKRDYKVRHEVLMAYYYSKVPQGRKRVYIVAFKDSVAYKNFRYPDRVGNIDNFRDYLEADVAEKHYYTRDFRYYDIIDKAMIDDDIIYQWRRKYVRRNRRAICPTLTANMGRGGHNVPIIRDKKGIRKLTPRECARFQGFDDNFILPSKLSDCALYKQIGNSVVVPVVAAIARQIMRALNV